MNRFSVSLTTARRFWTASQNKVRSLASRTTKVITARPMISFFGALVLLTLLLSVVKVLGTPKAETQETQVAPKSVKTYQIGAQPTMTVQAKVEKTGVITIVAQTGGVVRELNATEGDQVRANQVLLNLAATYGGANPAGIQRQIAQKSFTHAKDTFDAQLTLINQRRELAEKTDHNSDELTALSRDTLARTRDQLTLNESILTALDANLQSLQSTSPATSAAVIAAQQQKAQALAAVSSLRDAVASLEYSTDADEPPTRLSDLGREVAIKGLELEEKGLRLSLEIAELNLKLTQVSEAMYYPQAPFAGTVERVFVKPGQSVQPGTPLLALAGTEQSLKTVALVSGDVAKKVSQFNTSRLYLPTGPIDQVPQYIASEPTDGSLFAITWCNLDQYADQLANQTHIMVDVPVGQSGSLSSVPFIPIDSVYQTQREAYVFVMGGNAQQGQVESRQVKLGAVFGSFVQVESGLTSGDRVILDRTVVTGDQVTAL